MEKRRIFILSILLTLYIVQIRAQWDTSLSGYWAMKGYYNPSFTGESGQIRTANAFRYQWTGLQAAPNVMIATADMPFEFGGERHGLGIVSFSENVRQTRNTLLAGQYAFRKKIGRGSLGIGIQAGMYNLQFDAGNMRVSSDSVGNNTPMVKVNTTEKKALDFNAGISWSGENFYAGISSLHLTEPLFYAKRDSLSTTDAHTDSIRMHIPRSYNFIASCNIRLSNPLVIQPMVWIQSDLTVTQVQATLRIVYDGKYSGGASWIKDDGYAFFAGAVIQGIEAGYAYNLHTSGIGKASKGSHEMYLRYNFPIDMFKEKKPPHKSIRLL